MSEKLEIKIGDTYEFMFRSSCFWVSIDRMHGGGYTLAPRLIVGCSHQEGMSVFLKMLPLKGDP
ncbi:MAG: hypothetical protein K9J17_09665 [Flavobacteriales bacterium]|nr:hypothetical protein [Flavobacteriales bacterium]